MATATLVAADTTKAQRIIPKRTPSFPVSRPLRPFPTLNTTSNARAGGKPVKIIQPPKNQSGQFVLNLTQAEFSRQE